MIPNDFIPTTHSGYISLEVQEGFKYGFNFSVCNILNNVGYLMTRNQYDIKGIIYVNHNTQKLSFVSKYQPIPLLYPEGMLFPYLNLKYTNDKCYILGVIPSSLLNSCCIQEGFSYIQQHICTRLTSH